MTTVPALQSDRPFNALNGLEIKKSILNQISRQLDADTRFSHHLTYPRISWAWKLAIDIFPNDTDKKFESQTDGTILPPKPRQEDFTGVEPERVILEDHVTVAAPVAGITADQQRRDAGIPVPVLKRVEGPGGEKISVEEPPGVLMKKADLFNVEAPKIPVPDRNEIMDEGPRTRSNVAGSKGVLAKSVTLKTRAAPKGVEVPPAQGRAPTPEDVEKIIERGIADGSLEEKKE